MVRRAFLNPLAAPSGYLHGNAIGDVCWTQGRCMLSLSSRTIETLPGT